jgi:hypothetical protein
MQFLAQRSWLHDASQTLPELHFKQRQARRRLLHSCCGLRQPL